MTQWFCYLVTHLVFVNCCLVICEFQELKQNRFFHPILAAIWRIRVHVFSKVKLLVNASNRDPVRLHEFIASVICWHYIQVYRVDSVWIQAIYLKVQGWEHPPVMINVIL